MNGTQLHKLEVTLDTSTLLRRAGHVDQYRTYQRDGFDSAEVSTPPQSAERLLSIAASIEAAVLAAWPTGEGKSPLGSRTVEWSNGKVVAGYWMDSSYGGKSFIQLGCNARTTETLKRLEAAILAALS